MSEKNLNLDEKELNQEYEKNIDLNQISSNNSISELFKYIRKILNITQNEMGTKLGVTSTIISNIEKSTDDEISLESCYRIYFFAQEILDNKVLKPYLSKNYFYDVVNQLKVKARNNIIDKIT